MSLFKKNPWITQEVIDYLMSLPAIYQIFYVVRINKDFTSPFLFRDENGKMVANLYEHNVIAIRIQYQEDGLYEDYGFGKTLDKYYIPYIKKKFESFFAMHPTTQSNVKPKDLYMMQYTLRDSIERATGVRGIYNDDKDIILELNRLPFEARKRLADFVMRLDDKCIPVSMSIIISGSTDEQIGATADELALFEMEQAETES